MPSAKLACFTAPVIALGAAVIAAAAWQLPATPHAPGWLALGALAVLAATFGIKVPGVSAWVSISDTFFFTSVLLFGPAPATVSIALDSLIMSWRRRHRLHQLLFNPTSSALALWCGSQLFSVLHGGPLADATGPPAAHTFLALGAMAAVYFGLNSGLTVIAVGLDKRLSPFKLWRDNFAIISLNYFAAASAAFFLVALMRNSGVGAAAAVLPLICICYFAMRSWLGRVDDAQRHIRKINEMYLSTIGAFSTAIEAKDGVTSDHVHRVQAYALGLARALGITDASTLQALEAAALLHDTGKLAVPEHILNKPGRLTAAEFEIMQGHVDVGADILSSIDFPYPVIPIVRAHHENWDGTGYPRRIAGKDIPIGARILSVVDCFDALTSDRPYRGALPESEAIDIIRARRGSMYDPEVVDTFIQVYRDIAPTSIDRPLLQSALRQIRHVHKPVPAPVAAAPVRAEEGSDELLAFVSLGKLAARTPSMHDVGAVAWTHLRPLVPQATFALMSLDTTRGVLTVRHASGPARDHVADVTIEMGRRVSGWAAANSRVALNSEAQLDVPGIGSHAVFATALPLVHEGQLIAVMSFYTPEPIGNQQAQRLEIVAPYVAALTAVAQHDVRAATTRDLRIVERATA